MLLLFRGSARLNLYGGDDLSHRKHVEALPSLEEASRASPKERYEIEGEFENDIPSLVRAPRLRPSLPEIDRGIILHQRRREQQFLTLLLAMDD